MTDGNRGSPLSRVTHGKSKFFGDDRGSLDVLDIVDHAPFRPVRMFWISGVAPGTARGGHAHKACSQFFVCIDGRIQVDAFEPPLATNLKSGKLGLLSHCVDRLLRDLQQDGDLRQR